MTGYVLYSFYKKGKGIYHMRRLFALLMAAMLLLAVPAFAEETDFASMTDEALHALIDGARNELVKRELVAGGKILLFEQDGVQLYLTGNYTVQSLGEGKPVLQLEGIVINDTEQMIGVYIDTVAVNGWDVYGGCIINVDPGKKKKASFEIRLYDGEAMTYEEIEEITFNFRVSESSTYKKLFDAPDITVQFNQE